MAKTMTPEQRERKQEYDREYYQATKNGLPRGRPKVKIIVIDVGLFLHFIKRPWVTG